MSFGAAAGKNQSGEAHCRKTETGLNLPNGTIVRFAHGRIEVAFSLGGVSAKGRRLEKIFGRFSRATRLIRLDLNERIEGNPTLIIGGLTRKRPHAKKPKRIEADQYRGPAAEKEPDRVQPDASALGGPPLQLAHDAGDPAAVLQLPPIGRIAPGRDEQGHVVVRVGSARPKRIGTMSRNGGSASSACRRRK